MTPFRPLDYHSPASHSSHQQTSCFHFPIRTSRHFGRSLFIAFCQSNGRVVFAHGYTSCRKKLRRASSKSDLEEEVILGRIIGLIGCTCLVIAALRLANLAHDDSITLKGGEDRVGTQEKLSPREHFKRGKELYLRGRYFEAMPHLEEASLSTTGLTASERRQTEDCLNRARTKVQTADNDRNPSGLAKRKSVVRGQSGPWDDEVAAATNTRMTRRPVTGLINS